MKDDWEFKDIDFLYADQAQTPHPLHHPPSDGGKEKRGWGVNPPWMKQRRYTPHIRELLSQSNFIIHTSVYLHMILYIFFSFCRLLEAPWAPVQGDRPLKRRRESETPPMCRKELKWVHYSFIHSSFKIR